MEINIADIDFEKSVKQFNGQPFLKENTELTKHRQKMVNVMQSLFRKIMTNILFMQVSTVN